MLGHPYPLQSYRIAKGCSDHMALCSPCSDLSMVPIFLIPAFGDEIYVGGGQCLPMREALGGLDHDVGLSSGKLHRNWARGAKGLGLSMWAA